MTLQELGALYPDAAIQMDVEVDHEHPNHTLEQIAAGTRPSFNIPVGTVLLISPGCKDWQINLEHKNLYCTCWFYAVLDAEPHWRRMPSNIHEFMSSFGNIADKIHRSSTGTVANVGVSQHNPSAQSLALVEEGEIADRLNRLPLVTDKDLSEKDD